MNRLQSVSSSPNPAVLVENNFEILDYAAIWSRNPLTFTKADFTDVAYAQTVTTWNLPPGAMLRNVLIKHMVAFAGGSITTVTVNVGGYGAGLGVFITFSPSLSSDSSLISKIGVFPLNSV